MRRLLRCIKEGYAGFRDAVSEYLFGPDERTDIEALNRDRNKVYRDYLKVINELHNAKRRAEEEDAKHYDRKYGT